MPHTIQPGLVVATHPSILDPRLREAVNQSIGVVAATKKQTTHAKYSSYQEEWTGVVRGDEIKEPGELTAEA